MAADEIAKSFAPLVVVVSSLYYALVGLAKLRELYGKSDEQKRLQSRRNELEICKLEAEIAAIRKGAGLPPLSESVSSPSTSLTKAHSPIKGLAETLASNGAWGFGLLAGVTAVCQLVGWSSVGVLILAARYYFAKPLSGSETILRDGFVVGAIALVGAGALVVGFRSFGPVLFRSSPRAYRAITLLSLAIALILMAWSWHDQSEEIIQIQNGGVTP